jgi:diguanylate cyclase with GGDEF domain
MTLAVGELMASVAAEVSRRISVVCDDVYEVTLREIAELHDDQAVLALFASSIHSNVSTCLQIMQHQIDLADVRAPAASLEYARRRAQRGTPLTALLRTYRLGHTIFSDWAFKELARQTDDAQLLTAITLSMSKVVAGYVDQTSEEIVTAYTQERENWLRNRSAIRAARIRDLLSGQRINVSVTETVLGYRLRQYHVGVVCWAGAKAGAVDSITRLERAIAHIAAQTACGGDPVFVPRDESSAWAWLPLGIRDTFDATAASTADLDGDLHAAFGDAVKGATGRRRASAAQSEVTATTSSSRCKPAAGSAPPCSSRGSSTQAGAKRSLSPSLRRTERNQRVDAHVPARTSPMVAAVDSVRNTLAGSVAISAARPAVRSRKMPAHSQVAPWKKRCTPGCCATGWRSATTSAASRATSGSVPLAVRANRMHMARFASGNWSRNSHSSPLASTTTVCSVSTTAEIVSKPGTDPVATLRIKAVSQMTASPASRPASRPQHHAPTR